MTRATFLKTLLTAIAGVLKWPGLLFRRKELGRHFYVTKFAFRPLKEREFVPIIYLRACDATARLDGLEKGTRTTEP